MSWIGNKLTHYKYVRTALVTRADLSRFRRRPDRRTGIGLIMAGSGLILGWPGASLMLVMAAVLQEPILAIYVAPALYIFSWIPYVAGIWYGGPASLAYLRDFNLWVTRIVVEKVLGGKMTDAEIADAERADRKRTSTSEMTAVESPGATTDPPAGG